jgi:hypothetical protein
VSRSAVALGCVAPPLFALLGLACETDSTPDEPFIAFGADFAGYHAWKSFVPILELPGNDHLNGTRTVFVNRLPEPGSAEFPVGTIFVKESGDGDPSTRHVFASVKRGAGFNKTGAIGWEWFELENGSGDEPTILWRGVGPTNGDAYGGDATGGCNLCHDSKTWDYAWTAKEFHLLATFE